MFNYQARSCKWIMGISSPKTFRTETLLRSTTIPMNSWDQKHTIPQGGNHFSLLTSIFFFSYFSIWVYLYYSVQFLIWSALKPFFWCVCHTYLSWQRKLPHRHLSYSFLIKKDVQLPDWISNRQTKRLTMKHTFPASPPLNHSEHLGQFFFPRRLLGQIDWWLQPPKIVATGRMAEKAL